MQVLLEGAKRSAGARWRGELREDRGHLWREVAMLPAGLVRDSVRIVGRGQPGGDRRIGHPTGVGCHVGHGGCVTCRASGGRCGWFADLSRRCVRRDGQGADRPDRAARPARTPGRRRWHPEDGSRRAPVLRTPAASARHSRRPRWPARAGRPRSGSGRPAPGPLQAWLSSQARREGSCSSCRWPNISASASASPPSHGSAPGRVTVSSGSAATAFA